MTRLSDEIKTFLLAGHETSSMMLTWALLELSRHADMLARVRAEADATFADSNVSERAWLRDA
jgi:cytochrome P450